MKADIPAEMITENRREGDEIKGIATYWKKSKLKAFLKGFLITAALFTLVFLGYLGLFRWNIMRVPMDVVEITDVSRLTDGRIVYHVRIADGYALNECRFETDGNGAFYFSPYRPIIKKKTHYNQGLSNSYYVFDEVCTNAYKAKYGEDAEVTAMYYGNTKDNILIWKKGMDLPEASKEVEEMFAYR